jgi:hypothetical protein
VSEGVLYRPRSRFGLLSKLPVFSITPENQTRPNAIAYRLHQKNRL